MTSNSNTIIGAVIGDVIGSVFEWDNVKTTDSRWRMNCLSSILLRSPPIRRISRRVFIEAHQSSLNKFPLNLVLKPLALALIHQIAG